MLVLSRKLGEKICIGENICITVVDIDRGKIRLGIEAPREIPVFRQATFSTSSWAVAAIVRMKSCPESGAGISISPGS